jgi:hypothetical protein
VPVLPFVALLIVGSACAAGRVHLMPLAVALASFVAQTHVGFAPAAAAAVAIAVGGSWLGARGDAPRRSSFAVWTSVSLTLLLLLWLLPIAEQLAYTPGNMSDLWRFFGDEAAPRQPPFTAWSAWGDALAGAVHPRLRLPQGWAVGPASLFWPACSTLVVASLPVLGVRAWRSGGIFLSTLAATAFVVSLVALWSVLNIRSSIADHAVFWLAGLGIVNTSLLAATIVMMLPARSMRLTGRPSVALSALTVLVAAAIGYRVVRADHGRATRPAGESAIVDRLTRGMLEAMAPTGIQRPVLDIDGDTWSVGAGIVLEFVKTNRFLTVMDDARPLFDRPRLRTGEEDAVLTLARGERHAELAARPGNIVLAEFGGLFIDGVRLPPKGQ